MSFFRRLSRRGRKLAQPSSSSPDDLVSSLKRHDTRAAEFSVAYDALRAEAALLPDGSLRWPSPALEIAAARVLADWARFNERHGLPLPGVTTQQVFPTA